MEHTHNNRVASRRALPALAVRCWAWARGARWVWMTLLMVVVTRMAIALVAYVAAITLPDHSGAPFAPLRPDNLLVGVFGSQYDAHHYLQIATNGYQYPDVVYRVAFFPLLPLLMRAGAYVTGDPLVAGLICTNLALFGAMLVLWRLVEHAWGGVVAERAVWYMLIFPVSFFGSANYTESLFLIGTIGALHSARQHHWALAAVCGMVASASRLVGVIVAPVLLVEWWAQRRQAASTAPPVKALLAPMLAPLGTGAYMLYLHSQGDALAFLHVSADFWHREPQLGVAMFVRISTRPPGGWYAALLAGQLPINNWIDLVCVIMFVIAGVVLLRWRRWAEGVFVLLGALIPFASGLLNSQRRYMWVLFPAFIVFARWGEWRGVDRFITALFLAGLGLMTALFANNYWVA